MKKLYQIDGMRIVAGSMDAALEAWRISFADSAIHNDGALRVDPEPTGIRCLGSAYNDFDFYGGAYHEARLALAERRGEIL